MEQAQESAEETLLGEAVAGDGVPGLGAGDDGADGQGKDVRQEMALVISLAAGGDQVGEHLSDGQLRESP